MLILRQFGETIAYLGHIELATSDILFPRRFDESESALFPPDVLRTGHPRLGLILRLMQIWQTLRP